MVQSCCQEGICWLLLSLIAGLVLFTSLRVLIASISAEFHFDTISSIHYKLTMQWVDSIMLTNFPKAVGEYKLVQNGSQERTPITAAAIKRRLPTGLPALHMGRRSESNGLDDQSLAPVLALHAGHVHHPEYWLHGGPLVSSVLLPPEHVVRTTGREPVWRLHFSGCRAHVSPYLLPLSRARGFLLQPHGVGRATRPWIPE